MVICFSFFFLPFVFHALFLQKVCVLYFQVGKTRKRTKGASKSVYMCVRQRWREQKSKTIGLHVHGISHFRKVQLTFVTVRSFFFGHREWANTECISIRRERERKRERGRWSKKCKFKLALVRHIVHIYRWK